jgi:4-hydroxythreonine-4-phosphate dehydrogenase
VTPRLGITLGDPAGIGPEVVVKALARADVRAACRPVVIGDRETLRETAARLGERLALEVVDEAKLLRELRGAAALLPVSTLAAAARRPGRPTIEGARASYQYVETAARLAMAGAIDAIVTAPINKAWVTRAGFPISGHTELLRELTRARDVRMMVAGERLRVVLVTMHLALEAVPRALTVRDVARTIAIADEHLRQYHRLPRPRLAVAGLNPHAGEGGLFGNEEAKIIAPAVRRASRAGACVSGPYPADSLFFRAVSGEFDAVIAMYHDQGLIPFKLLHFRDGVNVTMGLPIVRTSPDHGTAYDIAGGDAADAGSMAAALLLAVRMAGARATTPARRPPRAHVSGARRRQAR